MDLETDGMKIREALRNIIKDSKGGISYDQLGMKNHFLKAILNLEN